MNRQDHPLAQHRVRATLLAISISGVAACAAEPRAEPTSDVDFLAAKYVEDPGYSAFPRWNADVNGDGFVDYCRFVGSWPDVLLSCALRDESGEFPEEYAYNSIVGIDLGDDDSVRALVDVNNDGGLDFCRIHGDSWSNKTLSCNLATEGGFERNEYGFNSPALKNLYVSRGEFVDDNNDGRVDYCAWFGRNGEHLWDRCCVHNRGDRFGSESCRTWDSERSVWLDEVPKKPEPTRPDPPAINQAVDASCYCALSSSIELRQSKRLCFDSRNTESQMYNSAHEQCLNACVRVANNNWLTTAGLTAYLESFSLADGECLQSLDSFQF